MQSGKENLANLYRSGGYADREGSRETQRRRSRSPRVESTGAVNRGNRSDRFGAACRRGPASRSSTLFAAYRVLALVPLAFLCLRRSHDVA